MCNPTTLNDYLSDKKLWDSIRQIKAFPFLEGNGTVVMESSLKVLFGQRIMFSPMLSLGIETVAQQLVFTYGDKWLQLTTAATDLNLAGDYVIKKKGSKDKTGSKNTESETTHKTIAYNETELSAESADHLTGTDTTADNETSTADEEKISYSSYFNNLQNADKLDIMNLILRDAAKLLTINTY